MEDELRIRLYSDNEVLTCCNAHYIGLMGMFVDADPLKYLKGANLDVEISVNNLSGTSQHRLAAIVTARSIKGVGLTFVNLNKHTCLFLRNIIISWTMPRKVGSISSSNSPASATKTCTPSSIILTQ